MSHRFVLDTAGAIGETGCVAGVMEAAGLAFPAAVRREIRARIQSDEALTRTELSREVCRWMHWRAPNGQLREMACRLALLELEERGEVVLPARRAGVRSRMAAQRWEGIHDRPLRCDLAELGPLALVSVSARDDRERSRLWNDLLAGYHYLGYTPLVGAQQRYLIASAQHGYLGALGWQRGITGSAGATRCAPSICVGWCATRAF